MLGVDHLMVGVSDFASTAARWQSQWGLTAVEGVHFDQAPGWGSWVVPMADTWIELLGIVDAEAMSGDPRAEAFSRVVAAGDRLLGWALAPDDLEAVADRLGLPTLSSTSTGTRTGMRTTWRQLGFDQTRAEPYLPFFVAPPMRVQLTKAVGNPPPIPSDVQMELTGNPKRLEQWLGDIETPFSIDAGRPALVAHITTAAGRFVLR
jgi:hypothetical protein